MNAELGTVTDWTVPPPGYDHVTPMFTSLTYSRYVPASFAENSAVTSCETMLLVLEIGDTVGDTVSRSKVADADHSIGSGFVTQTVMRFEPSVRESTETVETTSEFGIGTLPVSTGVPTPQEADGPA